MKTGPRPGVSEPFSRVSLLNLVRLTTQFSVPGPVTPRESTLATPVLSSSVLHRGEFGVRGGTSLDLRIGPWGSGLGEGHTTVLDTNG